MRGRRKKRGSNLPALTFVNSPVFQRQPMILSDPVENPITARTIPVDEALDSSWVSPQFPRKISLRERRCGTRHSTRLRRKSEGDGVISSKFLPLQFLCNNSGDKTQHKQGQCTDGRRVSASRRSLRTTKSTTDLPMEDIEVMCGANITSENENRDDRLRNGEHHDKHHEDSLEKDKSSKENVDDDKNYSNKDNTGKNYGGNSELSRGTLDDLQNRLSGGGCKGPSCSKRYRREGCEAENSKLEHNDNNTDIMNIEKEQDVDRPIRSTNNCDLHISWTPPRSSRQAVILALDTPECDYGLTFRQRQLKYLRSRKV